MSRGYRSGGYNIQMLSDYLQNSLQKRMWAKVENDPTVSEAMKYNPNTLGTSVGSHLTLFDGVMLCRPRHLLLRETRGNW